MKNREIKFRAWDKKGDGMFSDVQKGILFDDGSKYIFENFINPKTDDFHEWILMQYTGRKDKRGTEIYEGDIITLPAGQLCEVKYQNHMLMAIAINPPVNYPKDYEYWTGGREVEVKGNIYENSELLSDSTH